MKRRLVLLLIVFSFLAVAPSQWNIALAQGARARAAQGVKLTVDATEAPSKLFRAHEVIPAQPGPLTLYYPEWIPGEHGPTGPIINLSGLKFTAAGKVLQWRRDPVDMYAFHIEVPPGANATALTGPSCPCSTMRVSLFFRSQTRIV